MVRRVSYILVFSLFFMVLALPVYALNTPVVKANHGVITVMLTQNEFEIGGELGINDNFAFTGNFGSTQRLGIKYEVNENFAITGGFMSAPYIGVNLAQSLNEELLGIAEFDLSSIDDEATIYYDLGLKYSLKENIDIRGGIKGKGDKSSLQIGFGYNF